MRIMDRRLNTSPIQEMFVFFNGPLRERDSQSKSLKQNDELAAISREGM